MSTFTENYNLIKPDSEDYYDVTDFNENMDTIDTLMAETETSLNSIDEKIGKPEETGQTLFSLLQKGNANCLTAIKSIQHITCALENTTTKSVSINPVVPENCICIFERLYDGTSSGASKALYTLAEDSIKFTCANVSNYITVGLWIIEFC